MLMMVTKLFLKSCENLKTEEVLCFKHWMISFCNSDKSCCHREADASMDAFDDKEIKNRRDTGSATCMLDLEFLWNCTLAASGWNCWKMHVATALLLWPLKTAASEIGFLRFDMRFGRHPTDHPMWQNDCIGGASTFSITLDRWHAELFSAWSLHVHMHVRNCAPFRKWGLRFTTFQKNFRNKQGRRFWTLAHIGIWKVLHMQQAARLAKPIPTS